MHHHVQQHKLLMETDEPEDTQDQSVHPIDSSSAASSSRGCQMCHDLDVRRAYRNVFGLGFSFFFLFSAFQAVQNLQSSVNAREGLGVISLGVLYVAFVLSALVTTSVVKVLGTKYTILAGMACHLIYVLCNFRGSWYTLVPASLLIGFASGPLWAAASAYITQVAVGVAPVMGERNDNLISHFTGTLFFFSQVSYVPGNLASTLILRSYASNQTNDTVNYECGNLTDAADGVVFEDKYWYILVAVFTLFDILAILILMVFVERLPTSNSLCSSKAKFRDFFVNPSWTTIKMALKWRLVFLGVMCICFGLVQSFALSVFAKEYVTECLGVSQVGIILIVLGLSNALTSGIVGKIVKYVPRLVIIFCATFANIGFIIFLLLWKRVPSYLMVCLFAIGWGFSSGVWNTISSSLVGILYPFESEPAYSVARMWQAFGISLGFVMSYFASQVVFLYFLLGTILVTDILYIVVELKSQNRMQLLLCLSWCVENTKSKNADEVELTANAES